MFDIYFALALMLALSIALLLLAWRIGRRLSRRALYVIAVAAVAALIGYGFLLYDNLLLARLLPFSNAVVLGNWFPPLSFILAGVALRLLPGRARKVIYLAPLIVICIYKSYSPLLGAPPTVSDSFWPDGVARQGEECTCSAAAAATLLQHYGIPAGEGEMARLCLTRRWGTSNLGLYRGLSIKCGDTGYKLIILRDRQSLADPANLPALIIAGLPRNGAADPRYERDWSWARGVRHAVVLYEFIGDYVAIGDPDVGRESWGRDSLDVLWRGAALTLRKSP